MVYEQSEVLQRVKKYYDDLYACFHSNLVDADLKLYKQLATGLEKYITEAEVLTVKQMKNKSSPGSDGYTVEFFWKDINNFDVSAINCI